MILKMILNQTSVPFRHAGPTFPINYTQTACATFLQQKPQVTAALPIEHTSGLPYIKIKPPVTCEDGNLLQYRCPSHSRRSAPYFDFFTVASSATPGVACLTVRDA
jgi:hypothetical protein